MAVLSDSERAKVWSQLMSDLSARREGIAVNKADLRAAINAVDQWVEDNKVTFNLAIPLPARTALTAAQKAELLVYVARRRFQVGS